MSVERVVVLGGRGFLGGAIAARATGAGLDVVGIGSDELDLTADDAGARLTGRLSAGDSLVFVSAIAPAKTPAQLVDNLRMAVAVCEAMAAVDLAHVVYVSSDAVYADDDVHVSEASAPSPSSLHGVMHLAREVALRASSRAPLCIIRPSLVYGTADPHNGYGPNRFRRQAAAGEVITLFGEGEETRDHVFVDDVADLVVRVLVAGTTGVLNAVTGDSRSFREVAEVACSLVAEPPAIVGTPRQNPITHRSYDTSAVARAFAGFSWTRLEEGLGRSDG